MSFVKKILLVDDDIDDLELFLEILKELEPHNEYTVAHDGVEALEKLEKFPPPPTLILLNLNMPRMNGLELLERLKLHHHYKKIPVVMLTTSHDPPDQKHAVKRGIKLFLTKANNLTEIKTQLKFVLENIVV